MLFENNGVIYFENDYFRVSISKNDGTVEELFNKMSNENALGKSDTPWFTYLLGKDDEPIKPKKLEIEASKLKVTYENNIVAFYIIEVKKTYFSVTLDSEIPDTVNGVVLCELTTDAPWELDNPDAYGLSGIAMTTTVDNNYVPGGEFKKVMGTTFTYLGVELRGSKLGVAFSRMTEHREHLKTITDDIDPKKGITSTHGGAYTCECKDLYGDYVLLGSGLTPETVDETIELCKKYSVEQIDMHQGGGTFVQGDFNFLCARTPEEIENNTFIPASVFKERIADKIAPSGIQLGLHTYSSLVVWFCERVTADPKWQKQIVTIPDTWTVNGTLNENDVDIRTKEDASNCIVLLGPNASRCPYNNIHTRYLLIDEEIILINEEPGKDGFINVERGQCGTKPAVHKDGTVIRQLCGWYGMFQPIPLSGLFYYMAEETARAYNEGGYEMIYLDGLESFNREPFIDKRISYYVYAEFIRTIVSNCKKPPLIEYSSFLPCLWAARGRGGAVDHARRAYKQQKIEHLKGQSKFLNCFYTATAGWFNYCPDKDMQFKDTTIRTMYRDDLDHMGSLCIAYDFGTVCQPFSKAVIEDKTRLADNFYYYGTYTCLREAGYFAPEVRKAVGDFNKEFKLFKQEDGSWAFKEMKYLKHKIYDVSEPNFVVRKHTNSFGEQKPFIRIEQRYSTNGKNGFTLFSFDESKPVDQLVGRNVFEPVDITGKTAFKIKVHGNGSESDALMISIASPSFTAVGHYDYFIPVNFTGWKEIILLETNNADYEGYSFEDVPVTGSHTFRQDVLFNQVNQVQLAICGKCEGVRIGDLVAYTPTDAPAKAPQITIGNETISFDAELHGGDFIEYYPEENKAYLNYYTQIYDNSGYSISDELKKDNEAQPEEDKLRQTTSEEADSHGKWLDDEAHVKEISFTGSVTVPEGDFSYSYKAEPLTKLTTRAQVVIGLSGKVVANPSDWTAPEIDMPENIEKVTLY